MSDAGIRRNATTGRWGRKGRVLAFAGVVVAILGTLDPAGAVEDRLIIVTSFPEIMFSRFTEAFQMARPGTRVKVLNRKTSAAISYIQEKPARPADLFWASAPDAFEVLKETGHLRPFRAADDGIGRSVGGYPVHDPDGFYTGFAVSGYGIMWNVRYLEHFRLPPPKEWRDLANPAYFRHVGISAPSRSGTTHVTVETVLQKHGWDRGWALLLEMAGNMATVTARSYGVPDGVKSGRFGIGLVIDFFGLSAQALGYPVKFAYPTGAPLIPANVAIVRHAANPAAAAAFIRFLLSPTGQRLLLDPHIRRLPVRRDTYAEAPAGYPNPFTEVGAGRHRTFDSALSKRRYHLVNALFDRLITYRIKALNRAWKAVHEAESALAGKTDGEVREAVARARRHAESIPVSARSASNTAFSSRFTRRKRGFPVSDFQAGLEAEWEAFSRENLDEATRLAEHALYLLERPPSTMPSERR